MTKETKTVIKELEQLRLEMFRSAAQLDATIQDVGLLIDDPQGDEYVKMGVLQAIEWRTKVKTFSNWDTFDSREISLWGKLLESL